MRCNCGFSESKDKFGKLDLLTLGASSSFIANIFSPNHKRRIGLGSSDILICPKCGCLYCDPRGEIKNTSE